MRCSASKIMPVVFLFILFAPFTLFAVVTADKTPNDVYQQVQILVADLQELRKARHITTPWPDIKIEHGHLPRYVFQKGLEILGKISSYRVNILKIGAITVPHFPGRDITTNEVYDLMIRLHQELILVMNQSGTGMEHHRHKDAGEHEGHAAVIGVRHRVYETLTQVSVAWEETLGLRGITPSEVYMRSTQIIDQIRFLRRSQNLPLNIPIPAATHGKFPNHALQSVRMLLDKIQHAEKNLWMETIKLPPIPRRVITPSDVYDAMGVVIAELENIQFRLGLERDFPDPKAQKSKSSDDDVIQNVVWATALLPEFELGKPLEQYDRTALYKTPNHVFAITDHIQKRLRRYRSLRGIQTPPRKAHMIHGLKPQHVYGKALEVMDKINVLRQQQQLGAIAVPQHPLRIITPSEVFYLALRLDRELAQIHQLEDVDIKLWELANERQSYEDKKPSDVFLNMQRISNLLDTILGLKGVTPNDVYREVIMTKQDIQIIAQHLGEAIPSMIWHAPVLKPATESVDVLAEAKNVLKLVFQVKQRAGIFGEHDFSVSSAAVVTPNEVFNQVEYIETELAELKVYLKISTLPDPTSKENNKTSAHVLQVLEGISAALRMLLHIEGNPS